MNPFRAVPLCLLLFVAVSRGQLSIIPQPDSVVLRSGTFTIGPKTAIVYHTANKEMKPAVDYLAERLRRVTGYPLPVRDAEKMPKKDYLFLNYQREESLGREGYVLDIDPQRVLIEPNNAPGFFYGVQTLLQLLPAEVFGRSVQRSEWALPSLLIYDHPRFPWRGMHLDVSRHFFPASFIKTYIDMLAMHKINMFHWHLTDDQGWRLEILKYPKLTSVGAWRVDREIQPWNFREPPAPGDSATYGGYYTQQEVREIVRYAAERNITIVPEIEMPAHATAALAAYPQFSCTGGSFYVQPGGVWPITEIFCAGNDSTFLFLQDVLSEVIALFPGTYIHIGGDEADKKEWNACVKCQSRIRKEGLKDVAELQSYFVKRIERFLSSKGRTLVGWDEILEGGIAPSAVVMSWRGEEGGIAAARSGHHAVMTPGNWCYFDHYQGPEQAEPPAIGGYTPLREVYGYEPVPASLSTAEAAFILGTQANLWTEYIPDTSHVQYMALPRMAAIAEAAWSSLPRRPWNDFAMRVKRQLERYDAAGYRYAMSIYLVTMTASADSVRRRLLVSMSTEMPGTEIRYTMDGTDPEASSPKYSGPVPVTTTSVIRAASFNDTARISTVTELPLFAHAALFRPYTLAYPLEKYDGGTTYALTNGVRGSLSFSDGNWVGFDGSDVDAVVDLGKVRTITSVRTTFLQNTGSWIFFPAGVEILVSKDGDEFDLVTESMLPTAEKHEPVTIQEVSAEFPAAEVRYIRVKAKNIGTLPDWHAGKGQTGYLFIDEIVAE